VPERSRAVCFSVAVGLLACQSHAPEGDSSARSDSGAGRTSRGVGLDAASAIARGDGAALRGLLPATDFELRIETRQTLVETDERTNETLRTRSEVDTWLAGLRATLACPGDSCRYPGGFAPGELARCAGDCCFSDWPAGVEKGTLHLRRICALSAATGERHLSYIGFVEAK